MRGAYVIIGLALLLFAILIYPIQVPRIEWTGGLFPMLQYKPFSLAPVAYIFATIGVISIIFGLTENDMIRIILTFLAVITCIAFLTGYITPEKIRITP